MERSPFDFAEQDDDDKSDGTSKKRARPRLRPEQFIRAAAPEAHLLHGAKAPERIGKVLMRGPRPETTPRAGAIETLNRAELLSLAGSIYIDGANLRQIYETHLIGERGLRRLTAEHLRGGDMHRALQHEITEHEIDFERDPGLRDRSYASAAGWPTSTASAPLAPADVSADQPAADQLSELLERAGADSNRQVAAEAAILRARAAHEARVAARHSREQRIVDVSMAGVILLLTAIIAVLIITR